MVGFGVSLISCSGADTSGGADPLQREPIADAFVNDAPQLLGQRDASVAAEVSGGSFASPSAISWARASSLVAKARFR